MSLAKYSHQTFAINLNSPESLQMHLTTRFLQLNIAADLKLYQEAFRSIEDIHGLMVMSRKTPKASMMSSYYHNLGRIFGVSRNYLFHAAAQSKHFVIELTNAKKTDVELDRYDTHPSAAVRACLAHASLVFSVEWPRRCSYRLWRCPS